MEQQKYDLKNLRCSKWTPRLRSCTPHCALDHPTHPTPPHPTPPTPTQPTPPHPTHPTPPHPTPTQPNPTQPNPTQPNPPHPASLSPATGLLLGLQRRQPESQGVMFGVHVFCCPFFARPIEPLASLVDPQLLLDLSCAWVWASLCPFEGRPGFSRVAWVALVAQCLARFRPPQQRRSHCWHRQALQLCSISGCQVLTISPGGRRQDVRGGLSRPSDATPRSHTPLRPYAETVLVLSSKSRGLDLALRPLTELSPGRRRCTSCGLRQLCARVFCGELCGCLHQR